MPLDPYSPCPGGTGKKIKFCCSELLAELEQLDKLTEGQQYAAALQEAERLLERTPGRACLLAHRTRLQLATKKFGEAAAGAAQFLQACPDNPVALSQAAVTEVMVGRVQEALALFDKARDKAREAGGDIPADLVRSAQTIVQGAAQTGHPLAAQGIVEWLAEATPANPEELRLLAAIVGAAGVPPALRTKMAFEPAPPDSPYRFEFDKAIEAAGQWRLSKALTTFRSLKGVAGESPELFTNIAILCEMLARPFEASEAWLAVARLRTAAPEDAIEATGRAIAMETEADPDRSPVVRMMSLAAPLAATGGDAIELLEDKLRHEGRCDPSPFDRSAWVSRGAVPPHSVWRFYAPGRDGAPDRLLAALQIFGRQTDREPEVILQGFEPDVVEARPDVERLLGCTFANAIDAEGARYPAASPTAWLESARFRVQPADVSRTPPAADAPSPIDLLLERERTAVWERFATLWPDTSLPELLGKTPRQAAAERGKDAARRVEALVREGEAVARSRSAAAAWATIRGSLGLPAPEPIRSAHPLEEVPPLRWHRVVLEGLALDELRMILATALDAGFEPAAARAAEAVVARPDSTPEDRWQAYGLLEERADTSLAKLDIIGRLRELAKTLSANDGMLDVAELRVRLSRADEAGIMRLLTHLQREHARDQRVIAALAEVLAEAGVDLAGLAAQSAAMPTAGPAAAARVPPAGAAEAGKIWTPGAEPPGPAGDKKSIWTPG